MSTLLALVDQFETAVREHEMIGSKRPSQHQQIERDYAEARALLLNAQFEPQPTLRDQFAMAALAGLLTRTITRESTELAADAYVMADAMLKARGGAQ